MPEQKINKANALGSLISVWGKILIGLFIFIVSIGTAWYQIQTNASENVRQDAQFHEVMETLKREFQVWGQRSDKRYQRAMDEAEELHHEDDKIRDDLKEIREHKLELVKEIWYLKGKLGQ